ncbi:MAG: hypothetical protein D6761_13565 [Candidatus Dadabacteria bacterium]|nr:MAG: hypothetical protein D6761_13565 [Candidatus Dadabacteria bacterium]
MPERGTQLLTFVWDGMPSALPADVVVAASDAAAVGELPVPLGTIRDVAVHGHTLYPLIRDPAAPSQPARTTLLFVHMFEVVAALEINGNVDLHHGRIEEELLAHFEDGETAVILDIEELLLTRLRQQEMES